MKRSLSRIPVLVVVACSCVALARNAEAGQFAPPELLAAKQSGAKNVFAADLDGDGDRDVLASTALVDEPAWYENVDGLGSFGPANVIESPGGSSEVFAADLDGEGTRTCSRAPTTASCSTRTRTGWGPSVRSSSSRARASRRSAPPTWTRTEPGTCSPR